MSNSGIILIAFIPNEFSYSSINYTAPSGNEHISVSINIIFCIPDDNSNKGIHFFNTKNWNETKR